MIETAEGEGGGVSTSSKDKTSKPSSSSTSSSTSSTSSTSSAASTPSTLAAAATATTAVTTTDVPIKYVIADKMSSDKIEEGLNQILGLQSSNGQILKYNMRLFGIPAQFSDYCDYRAYEPTVRSTVGTKKLVGRKFIENIMLEAPVITIVPGKPYYLPGAKNKRGLSQQLLSAANGSVSGLFSAMATETSGSSSTEKLRYYDFQSDYITYMKYVNIMCAVCASLLDLDNDEIDGMKLSQYDWKNYRWNADNYSMASVNMLKQSTNAMTSFVDGLKTYGVDMLHAFYKNKEQLVNMSDSTVRAFEDKSDKDIMDAIEDVLTQVNYVQFYVDASSGQSESASNESGASKIEGAMDSGSELFKEVAFLANSGGVDAAAMQSFANEGVDKLNEQLFGDDTNSVTGLMSRFLSAGSNIIMGDTMIFPEIYQRSSYSKRYSISVDLRTPYGNKLSYFINILVPLMHLVALAAPKQTTANTYSSPFLVKAYYPGIFSCNLGLVKQISVEKNPNGDAWSVDGYPTHVRVTLDIDDLYSELTMTPAGLDSIALFMANSSLVDYLATNCGVSLTTPRLDEKLRRVAITVTQGFQSIKDDVTIATLGQLENLIASLTGV